MITLTGLTQAQYKLAGLLWNAQEQRDVEQIMRVFGIDAVIVRDMLVAATLDEMAETDLAAQVLDKFRG